MNVTLINILGDGTIYPPLRPKDLIIRLLGGQISIGKFDRHRFITADSNYLTEPMNAADLKADALAFISAEMPGLFARSQTVYIICPGSIAQKAKWKTEPQPELFSTNSTFTAIKA
jgi:hypothetical protein